MDEGRGVQVHKDITQLSVRRVYPLDRRVGVVYGPKQLLYVICFANITDKLVQRKQSGAQCKQKKRNACGF